MSLKTAITLSRDSAKFIGSRSLARRAWPLPVEPLPAAEQGHRNRGAGPKPFRSSIPSPMHDGAGSRARETKKGAGRRAKAFGPASGRIGGHTAADRDRKKANQGV